MKKILFPLLVLLIGCEDSQKKLEIKYPKLTDGNYIEWHGDNPLANELALVGVHYFMNIEFEKAFDLENIIKKMVEGRINKFYQESCLMEQTYIKDPDKKVSDLLTETVSMLGENITVKRFIRFSIGESNN